MRITKKNDKGNFTKILKLNEFLWNFIMSKKKTNKEVPQKI